MIDRHKLKRYLLDLELIAILKSNDKLMVNKSSNNNNLELQIDSNYYYLGFITRWYYNHNRNDAVDYLESLILEIINIKKSMIENLLYDLSIELKTSLINSKIGLINLQTTYQHDKLIIARIQLIINQVNYIILELDDLSYLKNIPVNQIELLQNNDNSIYIDNSIEITKKFDTFKTVDTNNNSIESNSSHESLD